MAVWMKVARNILEILADCGLIKTQVELVMKYVSAPSKNSHSVPIKKLNF
jgi:hypothetical protein